VRTQNHWSLSWRSARRRYFRKQKTLHQKGRDLTFRSEIKSTMKTGKVKRAKGGQRAKEQSNGVKIASGTGGTCLGACIRSLKGKSVVGNSEGVCKKQALTQKDWAFSTNEKREGDVQWKAGETMASQRNRAHGF